MKIKWWGHSCFQITLEGGKKILTDPYNGEIGYQPINEEVDLVTVSHDHFDHNAVDLLLGNPEVIKTIDWVKKGNLGIRGIFSYHDQEKGRLRGENIIFIIEVNDKRICHLGDLGHPLTQEQLKMIGQIDILLIPVGGHFTIDADQAYQICCQLNPSIIFPMHYKTEVLDFPITGVDEFTKNFSQEQVRVFERAEIEIASLPSWSVVYILDYVGKK